MDCHVLSTTQCHLGTKTERERGGGTGCLRKFTVKAQSIKCLRNKAVHYTEKSQTKVCARRNVTNNGERKKKTERRKERKNGRKRERSKGIEDITRPSKHQRKKKVREREREKTSSDFIFSS